MSDHAEATESIAADPKTVYDLVSDVTRMGEWSPETTSCRWLGGATGPVVGARFIGSNKHGFRRWATICTVTDAEPGRRFSFSVAFGPVAISEWSYEFTGGDGECTVTESWVDKRPGWMRLASIPVMAVADRGAHNRAGMQKTLAALKSAAEVA
jgi:hypothetical protein